LAVCRTIEAENLLAHVETVGDHFRDGLRRLQARCPLIDDVRGRGLMLGLGLTGGAKAVERAMRDRGVIVNAIGDRTIRLVPPLIISPAEVDEALDAFEQVLAGDVS
jgi:acetylornithine aminotransferase